MMIAHYSHRLPSAFDVGVIRKRAETIAPDWDNVPDLVFKAFLLRERGKYGAAASAYASLYLWRNDEELRNFVLSDRFKTVEAGFGRPAIDTRFVLEARRGSSRNARFAFRQDIDIPIDSDLPAWLAQEAEKVKSAARQPGIVAAAAGIDTANWRLTHVQLSEREEGEGVGYQVLHLAQTLFDTLPA